MSTKIILHIGAGKTGTSYLQSCFAKNQENFKNAGILYPDSIDNKSAAEGKITSGNGMDLALYLNPEILPKRVRFSSEEIKAYFAMPELKQYQNIIFSSEWMARFKPERMKKLAEIIQSAGFDLQVIYYVRSIADHAVSAYSQAVKRHFYKQSCIHYMEHNYVPLFLQVVTHMNTVLGKDKFKVLNYDLLKKNIFSNFLVQILKCSPSMGFDDFSNKRKLCRHFNQSLSEERHSAFISDTLIYADPQKKAAFVIEPEEVEILEKRFAHIVNGVNHHLPQPEHIAIASSSLPVKKRENIVLSEYEKNLVNILSGLIRRV